MEIPSVATRILLALCVLNFAWMTWANQGLAISLIGDGPSLSSLVQAGGIVGSITEVEPWRYLSAVYVHLGILHLAMNMFALMSLGQGVEAHLGSARMILLFTLTGILGFLASRVWYGPVSPGTAGASGAIFGLMGYQVGVLHARKDPRTKSLVLQELAFVVAFALLFPVNNAAHLGGFVAGFAGGWLFFLEKRPYRLEPLARAVALGCLLLAVLSVGLSARSPVAEEARQVDRLRAISRD